MPTIYEKFKEVGENNPKRPAVYWKEKTQWQHFSYQKLLELVDTLTSSFLGLGINTNDKVAILSENRPEWLMSDLALNKLGAVSVPIHTTANQQLIEHVLKDSGSSLLIVSQNSFDQHKNTINEFDSLRKIILIADDLADSSDKLILFKDLIKEKKEMAELESRVADNDLASIIYTSGTTGEAKGVMLSNKNFLSNVEAANKRIKILPQDKFLSFMPLSHVLERTAGSYVPILNGAAIAYAENIKKVVDNLKEVKPTIIISVPKIFEKMYEKIMSGIKEKNVLIRKFFFWSLNRKKKSIGGLVADKLIYRKIRRVLGGHMRFAVSGGASIDEKILRFFRRIGIMIMEGYGLTETSPVVSVNALDDYHFGSVGQPLEGVEVKIAYDKEILVKGDNVMLGYWNQKQATKEVLDDDGWFKTGDLGFLDLNNSLTIIGRKKEIIVTANGKNIAPEKIENLINLSSYIDQSLVVGHGKSFLSVLIVPDYGVVKENVMEIMRQETEKVNARLMSYERIKEFRILDEPFTIENDELTPTLKVRRKIIEAKYKKVIDGIY